MTRKDYVAIAGILRMERESYGASASGCIASHALIKFAERLGEVLWEDNPRFNREHFLAVVRGERELTSRPPRRIARLSLSSGVVLHGVKL